jgi:hypothetical protein
MQSPVFIFSCSIAVAVAVAVVIFALGFSRLSQSYDPVYSNKVQPLLV